MWQTGLKGRPIRRSKPPQNAQIWHRQRKVGRKWGSRNVETLGPKPAQLTRPIREPCNGGVSPRTPTNRVVSDFRTPRAGEAPQPSFISFNIPFIFATVLPGSPHQKGTLFSPPGNSCTKVTRTHLPGIRAGYRLGTCRFLFRWKDMVTRGDKSAKSVANGIERTPRSPI